MSQGETRQDNEDCSSANQVNVKTNASILAEKFAEGFLFGCPECYKHMRSVAMSAAAASQGGRVRHVGKVPGGKF